MTLTVANNKQKDLTRSDVIFGSAILIGAQLACASTASCVHALPKETPSVLRALWRQILTSLIFGSLALVLLLMATLPGGVTATTSIDNGLFGFLNPQANPAALLHSLLPDCCGNFGIMIALSFFEPLIVSLIMLTEPLNASLIAMNFVGEAPPSQRTIVGVLVVLVGCGIVVWESSKEGKEIEQIQLKEEVLPLMECEERKSVNYKRRISQAIIFSPIGTIAPDATAKASFHKLIKAVHRRLKLPPELERNISMTIREKQDSLVHLSNSSIGLGNDSSTRRISLTSSIMRGLGQRLSFAPDGTPRNCIHHGNGLYGAIIDEDEEEAICRPQ